MAVGIGGSFLGPLFVHTALQTGNASVSDLCIAPLNQMFTLYKLVDDNRFHTQYNCDFTSRNLMMRGLIV